MPARSWSDNPLFGFFGVAVFAGVGALVGVRSCWGLADLVGVLLGLLTGEATVIAAKDEDFAGVLAADRVGDRTVFAGEGDLFATDFAAAAARFSAIASFIDFF